MLLGIDPTVDYVFKMLFGRTETKDLLILLLNAILRRAALVDVSILNPFNEKEFDDDKLSVLDVKARSGDGVWYNIEIQSAAPRSLPARLAYYGASLFVDQLAAGQDYAVLDPAITICFLKENLFRETEAAHSRFALCDCSQRLELTDRLQVHTIELKKYNFKGVALEAADSLVQWAFFLTQAPNHSADELKRLLPRPEFAKATEILQMIAQTPEQRLQYEARRKAELDYRSFVNDARQEGRAEGRAEGREEGKLEGRRNGLVEQIQLLQRLLRLPESPLEYLMQVENDLLTKLRDELQAKLGVSN